MVSLGHISVLRKLASSPLVHTHLHLHCFPLLCRSGSWRQPLQRFRRNPEMPGRKTQPPRSTSTAGSPPAAPQSPCHDNRRRSKPGVPNCIISLFYQTMNRSFIVCPIKKSFSCWQTIWLCINWGNDAQPSGNCLRSQAACDLFF